MKAPLAVALAVILTASAGRAARAQGRSYLGLQLGYNFDYQAMVIGAQLSAPLGPRLELYPSFNYYFVDPSSAWGVNLDLKYRLPVQRADWLYLGGGLNVTRVNAHYDAHVNLIAGAESRRGAIHPFGEFRLTAGNGSTIQLVGGVNVKLRGGR